MILKTKKFVIGEMLEEDINGVLDVYNSNQDFLLSHMDRSEISIEWLKKEQEEMKD
ncbi:hypothetical protein J2Z35_000958 [Acetoanaerobium pronyense]|uniref:Acetyltransferase n=1 Tax=Acetoanaerobium pronyense TaxID=1482736 RepID=A0ABS4KHA2_9FIRM|nr:hypothetical protein [Acetoanaerobium pronyense]MBP2027164.1 hypothetical protein [Acetoanaerobium pronyense]